MSEVLRTEEKYLMSLQEAYRLKGRMEKALHADPHNGPDGYIVRSLYFDSADDRDAFEKLNGVETRRKMRLRIYDPGSGIAYLEMKQKQGDRQRKRSLKVTQAEAEAFIRGDFHPLLLREDSFADECYAVLATHFYRPKTIVQYNREAFIGKENSTRITFDSRVIATESSFDLFNPALVMSPVLDPSALVLEVKYDGFLLDYFKKFLDGTEKSRTSVSKYMLARQQSFRTIP